MVEMNDLIYSNFIGPKAENIDTLLKLINDVLLYHKNIREKTFPKDDSLYESEKIENSILKKELHSLLERSKGNLPYHHPRYIAQMLKDPSIPTILGYLTFMLSNPNNHAYEGGPVTTEMEMEVVEIMKNLVGFEKGWGHLASGGSLANMEALWAARDFYKKGTVYFSEVSHYSWKRICNILRIEDYIEIPVDNSFRIDLNLLEENFKKNPPMFVMANLGSTGTGSVDNIEDIIKLKEKYGFHLHIDAAYGGFIRSAILDKDYNPIDYSNDMNIAEYTYRQLKVLHNADSITVDPHKHGLISYGAGAVLYKDENLRKVILNTAPYTYHKLDKPNIGMFSLEGSRPGAMAAACYLTYKVIPPNIEGIGQIVKLTLASAKKFYEEIKVSNNYENLCRPDLDINCFYRNPSSKSVYELNKESIRIYSMLSVETENPDFILSKFVVPPSTAERILPDYKNDNKEDLTVLRIVFMKHWSALKDFYYIKKLLESLEKNS